ncbi:hypothetical protein PHJA_001550900 [Phtheirospermum japonicum]|uniref:Replication protein A 70 kDa DNA-binding subunit B/D first OB fold domain-containing protein n=1 Tax=Phtheirospermum japonicum TaxID=374723 RepID=A0A830CFV8_9LAMI|nr:hypothetical protein PHJA_001550900 [Phtheirospermum japonicum]
MEVVLIDENHTKIQARIKKFQIPKMEKILKEGGFYIISNFRIAQNNDDFIANSHTYLLEFHNFTSARAVHSLPTIPEYGFNFVEFSDIKTDSRYDKLFVDVIAEVCGCDAICEMERYGVLTKRVTIHLRNVSVEKISGDVSSRTTMSNDSMSRGSDLVMGDMLLSLEFKSIEELDSISEVCHFIYLFSGMLGNCIRTYTEPTDNLWLVLYRMFKVTVRVKDGSGTASFVIFDPQVQKIIGKSAAELKNALDLSGDYDAFPDELDELLGKTFLFKLDLNKYTVKCKRGRVYTVGKLSCDERIIGPYLEKEFMIKSPSGESSVCVVGGIKNKGKDIEESTVSSIGESGMKSEFATPSSKRTNKRSVAGVSDAEQPEDEFDTQISSSRTNIRSKKLKATKKDAGGPN